MIQVEEHETGREHEEHDLVCGVCESRVRQANGMGFGCGRGDDVKQRGGMV